MKDLNPFNSLYTLEEFTAMEAAISRYIKAYGMSPTHLYIFSTEPQALPTGTYLGCQVLEYGPNGMEEPHCVYALTMGSIGCVFVPIKDHSRISQASPTKQCVSHNWASYAGLQEVFEYCTICDEKRK